MSEETQVEVAVESPAPVKADDKPTRAQVITDRGWSPEEADKAEKFGMLKKDEPAKEPVKEAPKPVAKAPEPVAPARREEDRRSGEIILTPEQEATLRGMGIAGVSGLMSQTKYERALKQKWRQEAEQYKARIAELEKGKPEAAADGEIDPDAPLTLRQIEAREAKRAEEQKRQQQETQGRTQRLTAALETHEELARASYPDFPEVAALATDLMTNLAKHYPSPKDQARVRLAYERFLDATAKADQLDPENDLTEADLAYEVGKLHPNYGKKASDGPEEIPAADDGSQPEISPNGTGDHTPEKLKRLEAITQRRASSASIPGGSGRRTVSPSEVTLDHLNRMTRDQLSSFKEKHPERYQKLMRG